MAMPYVHIIIGLALAQFFYFSLLVGKARSRYNVPAPATTGNEMFERYFRVHMNTLELLVMLIPSILIFGIYLKPLVAAGVGVVYIIGRFIYLYAYAKDPKSRSLGFALSILPILVLLVGGIFGAIRAAVM
jgi:glutathione S-transferase